MSRLERLLRPRSIAVFGGDWARSVVEQSMKMGFSGDIWPVHPSKAEVCGIGCIRSVEQLPAPPDASFIGVNRDRTIAILRSLSQMGAGGAVCFASGFAESGREDRRGIALQASLLAAAGEMPFLGPNCYGLINYLDGSLLWPDQHGGNRCERGVGIVTQSSNIAINLTMQRRGLPIGCVVTAGNQASVTQSEIAGCLLDDPRITAIGLHIEGFGDIDNYVRLAERARQLQKPIVAIKAGRSEKSRAATVSHTGSIVGSELGASALFGRLGIGQVDSIPELLETLKLLHCGGPLAGRRLGSLSCSGGEACLVADSAVGRNVRFEDLGTEQTAALRCELGPMVHLANPLDYHTYSWGDERALLAVFKAMLLGEYDLAMLVMDFPRADRCSDLAWEPAVAAIRDAGRATGRRVAVVASMPEGLPERWSQQFLTAGIVPLQGIDDAIRAAETAADIGESWQRPLSPPLAVRPRSGGGEILLDEAEAKQILHQEGIAVPQGAVAGSEAEAISLADQIGYPVVLKRLGTAHKSEAGAIALGLNSRSELAAAMGRMGPSGRYLVERQIGEIVAELIIGVMRDRECGLLLMLGAGGVLAELVEDVHCRLLPVVPDEIETTLKRLKIWPILAGYRGGKGADIGALTSAIVALAAYAERNAGCLTELEINPFLALRHGGVAADALIRIQPGETEQ